MTIGRTCVLQGHDLCLLLLGGGVAGRSLGEEQGDEAEVLAEVVQAAVKGDC